MSLRSLVTQLRDAALTGELLQRIQRDERLLLRGAGRISRALLASALAQRDKRPLLVVVPTVLAKPPSVTCAAVVVCSPQPANGDAGTAVSP